MNENLISSPDNVYNDKISTTTTILVYNQAWLYHQTKNGKKPDFQN